MRGGRLVLDEPTDLPEGTELELVVDDEAVALTPAELRELDERLVRAERSIRAGRGIPGDEVFAKLRSRGP